MHVTLQLRGVRSTPDWILPGTCALKCLPQVSKIRPAASTTAVQVDDIWFVLVCATNYE